MRKINTGDVFKMARLLKHGNIVQTVRKAYEAGREKEADAQQIGMDTALDILFYCTEEGVEKEFYALMAGICEKTPKEIEEQPLEEMVGDIRRIARENDIANFWKAASGLSEKITD